MTGKQDVWKTVSPITSFWVRNRLLMAIVGILFLVGRYEGALAAAPGSGPWLIESSTEGGGWEYVLTGLVVTVDGDVLFYDNGKGAQAWQNRGAKPAQIPQPALTSPSPGLSGGAAPSINADDQGLSADDFRLKAGPGVRHLGQIRTDELTRLKTLIPASVKNDLPAPRGYADDAPGDAISVYVPVSGDRVRPVVISAWMADIPPAIRTNENAREIHAFMESLRGRFLKGISKDIPCPFAGGWKGYWRKTLTSSGESLISGSRGPLTLVIGRSGELSFHLVGADGNPAVALYAFIDNETGRFNGDTVSSAPNSSTHLEGVIGTAGNNMATGTFSYSARNERAEVRFTLVGRDTAPTKNVGIWNGSWSGSGHSGTIRLTIETTGCMKGEIRHPSLSTPGSLLGICLADGSFVADVGYVKQPSVYVCGRMQMDASDQFIAEYHEYMPDKSAPAGGATTLVATGTFTVKRDQQR